MGIKIGSSEIKNIYITTGLKTPTADFLSCYQFSGNANDSIGTNHGTVYGATISDSLKFTAKKNQGMNITAIGGDIISISMRYYFDTTGGDWNTLCCRVGGTYHHILIQDGTKEIGFYSGGFYGSGFRLTEKQRYHIALTKNGSSHKLYINGELKQNATNGFSNNSYNLATIGCYQETNGNKHQGALGEIDDLCIRKKELTQSEITAIYNSGNRLNLQGIIAATGGTIPPVKAVYIKGASLKKNIMPTMTSTADQTNKASNIPGVSVTVTNSGYYDNNYQIRQMYRGNNSTEKCNVVQVSGTNSGGYSDTTYQARTQVQFSDKQEVFEVVFTTRNGDYCICPVGVKLQVSNDGISRSDVKTISNLQGTFSKNTSYTRNIENPISGYYFRIYFDKKYPATGLSNSHGVTIGALQIGIKTTGLVKIRPTGGGGFTLDHIKNFDSTADMTNQGRSYGTLYGNGLTVSGGVLMPLGNRNDNRGHITLPIAGIVKRKAQARIYTTGTSWGGVQWMSVVGGDFPGVDVANRDKNPSHWLNMTTASGYTGISGIGTGTTAGNEYSNGGGFTGWYVYEIEYNNGHYVMTRYNDTQEVTESSTYTNRKESNAGEGALLSIGLRTGYSSQNYNKVDWVKIFNP